MKTIQSLLTFFLCPISASCNRLKWTNISAKYSGSSKLAFHHPPPPSPCLTRRRETNDSFDIFKTKEDEAEETLLRINFSFPSSQDVSEKMLKSEKALDAVRAYTQSFPFAAVLPVQPLTYLPVQTADGVPATKITFLRKKTAEKGSMDGGLLMLSNLAEDGFEGDDMIDNGNIDSSTSQTKETKQIIHLTAKRISKGQTFSKNFSEKQIILAFVKGLNEERGRNILEQGGQVEVESVFHLWM